MTIIEKYRTWLVENENNIIPFAPAHAIRKLTDEMEKAHGVFMDGNNKNDDANQDAVQHLSRVYNKTDRKGREHMIKHMMHPDNKEFLWQFREHGPKNHELTRALHQ